MILLGSANFFTDPVLVAILSQRFGYWSSTFLIYQLPILVVLASIGSWSKFFDRVGVLRFEFPTVWFGPALMPAIVAMAMFEADGRFFSIAGIGVLVVARVLNGLARGGGDLAWNIGHLHFASEHKIELYMGIHLGLTGLRGATMPILGWLANQYLHWGSFAISLGLALSSFVLFRRMARTEGAAAPVEPVLNRSDRLKAAAPETATTAVTTNSR